MRKKVFANVKPIDTNAKINIALFESVSSKIYLRYLPKVFRFDFGFGSDDIFLSFLTCRPKLRLANLDNQTITTKAKIIIAITIKSVIQFGF